MISFAWPLEGSPNSPLLQKSIWLSLITLKVKAVYSYLDIKTETKSKQAKQQQQQKQNRRFHQFIQRSACGQSVFYFPFSSKNVAIGRDEFHWTENFILHTRLSTAQVIMGLRWTASFVLITHSSPHYILSVCNHCINQFTFSTKCPLSSDFQYISPPWDPFLWPIQFVSWWKCWWINHFILFTLMLLPSKEEIMSGFLHCPARSCMLHPRCCEHLKTVANWENLTKCCFLSHFLRTESVKAKLPCGNRTVC